MRVIEERGNTYLLRREKTLFICSKRTPIDLYGQVFRWTDSLSARDCIVCFNSTEMEEEMVRTLLVNKIPTILVVMDRFRDSNNIQIERALSENRLLIVVLRRDEPRGKGPTPRLRNEYVMNQCEHIVCGYINKSGTVFGLLAGRSNVEYLVKDNPPLTVQETESLPARWTVGEDKTLLRMYYEDMGIHAIHKQLHRPYSVIRQRIRSITFPEEVLKGREFEDYVLEMFHIQGKNGFVLKEWRGDKTLGDIHPENNSHPDFVLDYQGYVFAVECKWRGMLLSSIEQDLFSADKLSIYQQFSRERDIPVFLVLGVGGEPSYPAALYNIPLSDIPYVSSDARAMVRYLRPSVEAPFSVTDFVCAE